uniref:Uncharacterized protein LOC105642466 n=2 Tax=Rhizophora mucronata TaxID=61149 RepID=A0A2P2INM1_RHIMU
MRINFSALGNVLPFPRTLRQLEREMETVIRVLQPGPLGIVEHKFSKEEIREANDVVRTAVDNWKRNAKLEQKNGVLNGFVDKSWN